MSEKKQPSERDARLAKALRDNLRRRKQAARKAPDSPAPKEDTKPQG